MTRRRTQSIEFQEPRPNTSKLISGESGWGEDTAFVLRMAAEKAILLAEADKKVSLQRRVLDTSETERGFDVLDGLKRERMRLKDKYDSRMWDAQLHADAHMVISLTDIETGQIVGEGELAGFDAAAATLTITRQGESPQQFAYARPLPVPEDLRETQTYFGMEQLVDIDILAIPEDTAWVFTREPYL